MSLKSPRGQWVNLGAGQNDSHVAEGIKVIFVKETFRIWIPRSIRFTLRGLMGDNSAFSSSNARMIQCWRSYLIMECLNEAELCIYAPTRPPFIHIMACCLFGAKPSSEPVLSYHQFYPLGTNFSEISIKIQQFNRRKLICKCRLHKGTDYVSASMF